MILADLFSPVRNFKFFVNLGIFSPGFLLEIFLKQGIYIPGIGDFLSPGLGDFF